jgi:hypothetical protein
VPILEPYPDEEDDDAVADGATAPTPSRRGPTGAAENNVVSTAVSALLSFLPSFE